MSIVGGQIVEMTALSVLAFSGHLSVHRHTWSTLLEAVCVCVCVCVCECVGV